MNIRHRLMVMNFLEFFVWGSWLISLGGYMFSFPGVDCERGTLVGATFGTMGIASIFMPTVMGILADRFINAEKLLGICHLLGAVVLYWGSTVTNVNDFYWVVLVNSFFFMPTIALNNTVSYNILLQNNMDVQKTFPPIRVWGTVGFIAAMWAVDILGWTKSSNQFLFAAAAGLCMGLYSILMPACKPAKAGKGASWVTTFGLDAFVLFRQRKMLIFFLFAMFLGAALQITNAFGGVFIDSFGKTHADTFAVKHPSLLISLSQISETLFILTIPFFLRRFGIKTVMLFSMLAWVLRFGLFGIGNPAEGLVFLVLSMVVYGMAFDFFNISGSLFVEREAPAKIRASAQGLFMLMTNGIGAVLGGWAAGKVVDYFTKGDCFGPKEWPSIWFCFAGYALVLAVLFVFIFKYKHDPKEELKATHH
jgi:MFS transporter, NHS family, xanthosine permease